MAASDRSLSQKQLTEVMALMAQDLDAGEYSFRTK
ncbi:unnamed protein product, partial [Amoebophrya sp. A25]|eukprot:GSA25T00019911001.1